MEATENVIEVSNKHKQEEDRKKSKVEVITKPS